MQRENEEKREKERDKQSARETERAWICVRRKTKEGESESWDSDQTFSVARIGLKNVGASHR